MNEELKKYLAKLGKKNKGKWLISSASLDIDFELKNNEIEIEIDAIESDMAGINVYGTEHISPIIYKQMLNLACQQLVKELKPMGIEYWRIKRKKGEPLIIVPEYLEYEVEELEQEYRNKKRAI